MSSVLIVFAHPAFEKSRVNKALIHKISSLEGVTVHDIYEEYADFNIDVNYEKTLLVDHDIIVLHHPFYWYSIPPLLKQWLDLVLEYGWAYGANGTKLRNKKVFNAITTGGGFAAYQKEGHNRFTVSEFLAPIIQTASLCKMIYYPPFVVHNSHLLNQLQIDDFAQDYQNIITKIRDESFSEDDLLMANYMNDLINKPYRLDG